jgi:hypothetical protein
LGVAFGLTFALTGCPAPGEGPTAEHAYHANAPIITALERFHQATGCYPATLETLVPGYLASAPDTAHGDPSFYKQDGCDSYSLEFSYAGPGMNHCEYTPQRKRWDCAGYY